MLKESVFGKAFEQHLFNYPAAKRIPGCRLDKVPYFLVGDEIFPLKDWLMRPYPGKLDEASNIFNYRLSRAMRVIENAFGNFGRQVENFQRIYPCVCGKCGTGAYRGCGARSLALQL